MLEFTVPEYELFDDASGEFVTIREQHVKLEHSLRSVAEWEAKWHKPFLVREEHSEEESLDYIRCMLLEDVDEDFLRYMPSWVFKKITDYMEDPYTATTISRRNQGGPNREIITAEVIYYWMVSANVPFECDQWNLNRLTMLLEVCAIKNAPPKKIGKNELRQRNSALNAARRAKLHSRG